MNEWGLFEENCYNYLLDTYANEDVHFIQCGVSDSTATDIEVYKNGRNIFNIETKMPNAQCGQFVLIPNDVTEEFVYSERNKFNLINSSKLIINYMNSKYEHFRNAGSAGEDILLPEEIFIDWIENYYRSKKVLFFITANRKHIIIPIENFCEYFSVKCKYRMKKSGSTNPTTSDFYELQKLIPSDKTLEISNNGKVYVNGDFDLDKKLLIGNKYSYLLRSIGGRCHEVRRLSNTCNSNVIFSISLKSTQNPEHLSVFKSRLRRNFI